MPIVPDNANSAAVMAALSVMTAAVMLTSPRVLALEPIQEAMLTKLESLYHQPLADDVYIAAPRALEEFYARRDFRPAWTRREQIDALITILDRADEDGLDPADYHVELLERMRADLDGRSAPLDDQRVEFDILLSASLARLAYHLSFGKVDPGTLDPDWNYIREMQSADPVERLQAAIDSDSLEAYIAENIPTIPVYGVFKATLARYRQIQMDGGWPSVPDGPTLKPGMRDPRVADLRARLKVTGELAGDSADDLELFDDDLEQAVREFQKRHALGADGLAGRQTIAAMNVPVEDRVDQLRVNLERTRWVFQDVEDDFVAVNIAGFRVFLFRDGQVIWTARAQVGKPYRKTPVFRSKMTYLVFNPTWTVPPGILRKDVLPAIRRDPTYLERKNMSVIDSDGNVVDPATVDWDNFRYMIRQEPGPTNALGRVKFIFPNSYFVFLHDTPSKALFDRPERTFSSGCIRVENPFELAELLLNDEEKWNDESIQRVLDSKRIQNVRLPAPLSVMLLYWTVEPDAEGRIRFLKDVYDRDAAVLAALDAEFVFSPPEGFEQIFETGP